ncbi:hypothetical protein Godav_008846 [Gossypium davidsonii]|uniref:RNase H type-1 domain-containing protein n=1 Tax=Gossypium davidsonii TaxID=34287 RepID=A0A7J8SBT2_GOSDV|nr:hypothetical protein [Gossypium davidsonii]
MEKHKSLHFPRCIFEIVKASYSWTLKLDSELGSVGKCCGMKLESGLLGITGMWETVRYLTLNWDILDGLTLLHRQRYGKVVIRFDCLQAIKCIQNSALMDLNSGLIRCIHQNLSHVEH